MTAERQSKEVFISYRRTQSARVLPAVAALEAAGISCFLDQHDIEPLEPFPQRLRQAIGDSLALLAWWSADFADSDHCLEEFRTAWQHARRQTSALHTRLWVINPERTAAHICAGELDTQNFLHAPEPGQEGAWAQALARQLAPRLTELRPLGTLAQETLALPAGDLHGVPQKSHHFTGRNAALMRIHSQLHPPKVGAQARAVAVQTHGLAGIGKTELATAYANDFAHAYPGGVFWVALAALEHVASVDEAQGQLAWLSAVDQALQYSPLAGALRDEKDQLLAPLEARRRLAGLRLPGVALWVLDNVPVVTPEPLRDAMLAFWRAPFADACTLVTTRDSSGIAGFSPVHLDVLSPDDALRLLATYRPIIGPDEKQAGRDIITQTGGHTQALVLLGEYVRRSPYGYVDLLTEMNTVGTLERVETVSTALRSSLGDRARGVLAAYTISLRPLDANARLLLTLAALCECNSAFPAALLVDAADMDGDAASAALNGLIRSALLTQRQFTDSALTLVEIHPLTAQVSLQIIPAMDSEEGCADITPAAWPAMRNALARQLIEVFNEASDIRKHSAMKPYLRQARYFACDLAEGREAIDLRFCTGQYSYAVGAYSLARNDYAPLLSMAQRVLGDEHPETLAYMNNIAIIMLAMGDLSASQNALEQLLAVSLRVLGSEHPDTISCRVNLAEALRAKGDLPAARAMQEQVLATLRHLHGPDHVDTLRGLSNLALTVKYMGDLRGARAMQEHILDVRRRDSGIESLSTLNAMNNLAKTLLAQEDLVAARAMQEQVLTIYQRVLGTEHPNTLRGQSNLAETLWRQGELSDARAMEEEVLTRRRDVLGPEHPDTITSMNNLAETFRSQGELSAAQELHLQALEIAQRVFGPNHSDTLRILNNLANTLLHLGDHSAFFRLLEAFPEFAEQVLAKSSE